MDVEAYYREMDKRMNMPDEDINEYLARIGRTRSRETASANNTATRATTAVPIQDASKPKVISDPPRVHQPIAEKQDQVAATALSKRSNDEARYASQSNIAPPSQKDIPKTPSPPSSPIRSLEFQSSPQSRRRKRSLSSDEADRQPRKRFLGLPKPLSPAPETTSSVALDASHEISAPINNTPSPPAANGQASNQISPRPLKRRSSKENDLGLPTKKKRSGSPKPLHRTPSPSIEEITSFTTGPKAQKKVLPVPKAVPKEPQRANAAAKHKITALKLQPIIPPRTMSASDPPTSPIEEVSIIDSSKRPDIATRPQMLQAGPSKLYLEIKERVAQHSSKPRDKVLKRVPNAPKGRKGETVEEGSVIYISSSSPSRASSPIPTAAAASSKNTLKKVQTAKTPRPPKLVPANGKKKGKPALVTPVEYAQKLQEKIAADAGKVFEGKALYQRILAGKNIFYVGGDMKYASERTRGRMDIIVRLGGNLLPVYDASIVTHIITDAHMVPTLRALGLKKLSEIPDHVPTVTWNWVVTAIGRAPYLTKEGLKVRMDEVWLHAAFVERMDAGAEPIRPAKGKGKARESVEFSRISEFTQDRPRNSSRARSFRNIHDSSEDEDEDECDVAGAPPSPPTSPLHHRKPVASSSKDSSNKEDPLAEFYAKARADHETGWSRHGEVEESDAPPSEMDIDFDEPAPEPVPVIAPKKRGWTCDNKEVQRDTCVNQDIIDKLQELKELHQAKPTDDDHWRVFSYSKCIRALKNHPKRIESLAEARAIRGVGEKTAAKIMEIIETGNLRRIGYETTDDIKATRIFQGIYGVGQSTAYQWYAAGCRTLEDIVNRKGGVKLTPAQEIGIRFYDDINDRMPREEAKEIFDLIKPIALNIDPKLFVEIMGSYRRGKKDCGDIDIMITRPTDDGRTHEGVMSRLLQNLHTAGIITEDLAVPEDPDDLEAIYRGLCRVPHRDGSRRRRIDFLTVPWHSRGAALLYYTGDDIFNRAIRMKASVLGYSLNQKGLFAGVVRDPRDRRVKLNAGTLLASETEEEIFKILNVPWQEPHERVRG